MPKHVKIMILPQRVPTCLRPSVTALSA